MGKEKQAEKRNRMGPTGRRGGLKTPLLFLVLLFSSSTIPSLLLDPLVFSTCSSRTNRFTRWVWLVAGSRGIVFMYVGRGPKGEGAPFSRFGSPFFLPALA